MRQSNPGCDPAHLGRLLPLWPHELADRSPAARRARIALLRRALRAERQRGLAGHWTYDLARHWALLRCYRAEVAALGKQPARVTQALLSRAAVRPPI